MIRKKKLEPSLFYSLKNFADDEFVLEESKGEDMYQYLKIRHRCEELALIEMKLNKITFMETFHKPQTKINRLISGNYLTIRKSLKGETLSYNLFNPNCLYQDQEHEYGIGSERENETRHKVIRNTYSITSSRINKKLPLVRNTTSQVNTNITKNGDIKDLKEKFLLTSPYGQTNSFNENKISLNKFHKHSSTLPFPNHLRDKSNIKIKNSILKANKLNTNTLSLHNIIEEKTKVSFNSSPTKMSKFNKFYRDRNNEEHLNELVDFIDKYENNSNTISPMKKISYKEVFSFTEKKELPENNEDKGFLMLRENFKQIDDLEKLSSNEENISINSQLKMNNLQNLKNLNDLNDLGNFTLDGMDKRNENEMERVVIHVNKYKNKVFEGGIE